MIFHNVARLSGLVPFGVCVSLLVALPVRGQEPPAQKDEIKAVARISKQLIEDVAGRKEVVAAIPLNAIVLGFRCKGMINGRSKLAIEMTGATKDDASFVVSSQGTADVYVRGTLGPVVALAPVWTPIASQTLVHFNGRKFAKAETTPSVNVSAELDRVEGPHGRLPGRAVGHFILPFGRLLIPRAEAQANPIGDYYLTTFVDNLADQIITRLNRTLPVEQSLHRLFPKTKDWVFQMSGDTKFLQAAYGPREAVVPDLPENPGRLKDVRLELWLRSTTTEAEALAKLSKSPLAKQLISKYLETIIPELAALTENRSVESVGRWLVISLGAPKAE